MNSLLNSAYFLTCFATLADPTSLVRLSLATREIPASFSRVVLKAREDQRVERIRVWMNEVLKIIPFLDNKQHQIMHNTNYSFFTCWNIMRGVVSWNHSFYMVARNPKEDNTLWKPSEQSHKKKHSFQACFPYNKKGEVKREQNIVYFTKKYRRL